MALDTVTRYVVLLSTPKHEHLFDAFPNVEVRVLPAPRSCGGTRSLFPWLPGVSGQT